jgi:hypothetical protein
MYSIINDLTVFSYYSSFEGDLRMDFKIYNTFSEAVTAAEKAPMGYRIISHHWELPVM